MHLTFFQSVHWRLGQYQAARVKSFTINVLLNILRQTDQVKAEGKSLNKQSAMQIQTIRETNIYVALLICKTIFISRIKRISCSFFKKLITINVKKEKVRLTVMYDELSELGSIDCFHDSSLFEFFPFVLAAVVCFTLFVFTFLVHDGGVYRLVSVVCRGRGVLIRLVGVDEDRRFPSQHDEEA